jgi:hypothetical protein
MCFSFLKSYSRFTDAKVDVHNMQFAASQNAGGRLGENGL